MPADREPSPQLIVAEKSQSQPVSALSSPENFATSTLNESPAVMTGEVPRLKIVIELGGVGVGVGVGCGASGSSGGRSSGPGWSTTAALPSGVSIVTAT